MNFRLKHSLVLILALILMILPVSCGNPGNTDITTTASTEITTATTRTISPVSFYEGDKPYSDNYRNFYEIFVGSFCDSNGDGMGDLNGITSKLDYLKNDLSIDGIWLMPIMPSPTYHKYDTTDYYGVDEDYGTMEDFDNLINECNRRGIKLIIDLMLNHSSSEHPWFLDAVEKRKAGEISDYADYYNFFDEIPEGINAHALGGEAGYYEGQFTAEMPDLNFNSDKVLAEFENIASFWLNKGVSGFRLDAAMHIYEDNEKSAKATKWFTDYCKNVDKDCYIVAEVWTTTDTVESPYQVIDSLDSLFDFYLSTGSGAFVRGPVTENAWDTASSVKKRIDSVKAANENTISAIFLTNHDMNRVMSYMDEPWQAKLSAAAYLLTPGNTFTYYGEEIGMTGEGRDENKRAPMLWSSGDSTGLTGGPSAMDSYTPPSAGVEEQLEDADSLLSAYKLLLKYRAENEVIRKGEFVDAFQSDSSSVAGYTIKYGDEIRMVLFNFGYDVGEIDILVPDGYKNTKVDFSISANPDESDAVPVMPENGTVSIGPMSVAVISAEM